MQALRQPGMRERHWQQLSEQLDMTLKPDKDFVLSKALDMHLMNHLDTIQKVPFSMHANKRNAAASRTCGNLSLPLMYMLYREKCAEILFSTCQTAPQSYHSANRLYDNSSSPYDEFQCGRSDICLVSADAGQPGIKVGFPSG